MTSSGNPSLKPEESTAYTLGVVIEPTDGLAFTVDYFEIDVDNLVSGVDYSPVAALYYANNGVVNLPGITVKPGVPDPEHPTALPVLGFIEYSYRNADSQFVSGVDVTGDYRYDFDNGIRFNSHVDASYLIKSEKTIDGVVQRYDGTLSPCDVTSCSGSPDWRATWTNSAVWNKLTVALTANYTAGLDNASVDYGGVAGDCASNIGASVVSFADGSPYNCSSESYLDFDMSASYVVNDQFTVFANILNLTDKEAPLDPSAAYGLFNYNPAWTASGFRGRYFRIGVKADF